MKLLKEENVHVFMDGPEICREYIITDKITFGTSTLQPGQTGAVDPGHPKSHEIFFGVKGQVIMRNPKTGACFILHEGDAILIEEGEPHELTNIGDAISVTSWSAAPSPSKIS
jgi:quercetin dioxygenase-like cupin family protein